MKTKSNSLVYAVRFDKGYIREQRVYAAFMRKQPTVSACINMNVIDMDGSKASPFAYYTYEQYNYN